MAKKFVCGVACAMLTRSLRTTEKTRLGRKFLILALLLSGVGLEAAADAAEVWAYTRRVTYLYPLSDGVVIAVDGASVNPNSGCDPQQIELYATASNYNVIASTLISAFSLGLTVDINYDNTSSTSCRYPVTRAVIYR